jgi:hypothetical protein
MREEKHETGSGCIVGVDDGWLCRRSVETTETKVSRMSGEVLSAASVKFLVLGEKCF